MWGTKTQMEGQKVTKNTRLVYEDSLQKLDLLIQDPWKKGMDSIHDMRIVNTGAPSYLQRSLEKLLQVEDKENKRNDMNSCLQQSHHFSPIIFSFDGILELEGESTLKRIVSCLTTKW